MLNSLAGFDPIVAAGILARTAVFIEDEHNPPVRDGFVHDELALRTRVLEELRARLGYSGKDLSVDIRQQLADALDEESDRLLAPIDTDAVLQGLGQKGALPSDLYNIHFEVSLKDRLGIKFDVEAPLIEDTIKNAEKEQHFDGPSGVGAGSLISLFSKFYPNAQYPARGFTLLVAGQRGGRNLLVAQAWRLYVDVVDISTASNLLEALRLFVVHFGYPVRIENAEGVFLQMDLPAGTTGYKLHMLPAKNKGEKVAAFQFGARNKETGVTKLIAMGINVGKYLKLVNSRGW